MFWSTLSHALLPAFVFCFSEIALAGLAAWVFLLRPYPHRALFNLVDLQRVQYRETSSQHHCVL